MEPRDVPETTNGCRVEKLIAVRITVVGHDIDINGLSDRGRRGIVNRRVGR